MIPTERVSVPTKFLTKPATSEKLTAIHVGSIISSLRQNSEQDFSVRLNLNAICRLEKLFQVLSYRFQLSANDVYNDEFLVNCDSRYIYVAKNRLVPYNLRYWTPPFLVDILKLVQVDETLLTMKGEDLVNVLTSGQTPTFTFLDTSAVLIDSKKSSIDFVIQWQGLRYYLVNFYWLSLFLGAGGIWVMSSFFCVITTLLSVAYFTNLDQRSKKE